MSERSAKLDDHQIWSSMQQLGGAIDALAANESIEASSLAASERARLVLAYIGKRIGSADHALLVGDVLADIAQKFDSVRAEIIGLQSNPNAFGVRQIEDYCDAAIRSASQLPTLASLEEFTGLEAATKSYQAAMERTVGSAQARGDSVARSLETLQEKISELTDLVEAQTHANNALVADLSSKAVSAQEQRTAEYTAAFDAYKQRDDRFLSEFQSQFSVAQDTRSTDFATAQTIRQDRFSDLLTEYSASLTARSALFDQQNADLLRENTAKVAAMAVDFSAKAQGILDYVEERRIQVEKLVGVIGNLGVTSGYLRVANRAQVTMWVWQVFTVLAMAALVCFAWQAFLPVIQREFSWESFGARSLLTATVGVLAGYCAKQADKFFEMEKRNRRLALELEALLPYVAGLPESLQHEFRLEVGRRSFAQEEPVLKSSDDFSPATLMDMLKSGEFKQVVHEIVQALRK